MTPPLCYNGFIASKRFFVGLVTMIYSLRHHDTSSLRCTNLLAWHPREHDTDLDETEKEVVAFASGDQPVEYIRPADELVEKWQALKSISSIPMLKLTFFYLKYNCSFAYFDSDMLALKSTAFIHEYLTPGAPWLVHFSGQKLHYNTGFFAMRMPAPQSFLGTLENEVDKGLETNRNYQAGDQSFLNSCCREKFLAHNWKVNYGTQNATRLLNEWVVLHWSGVQKPWGTEGTFSRKGNGTHMWNHLWLEECEELRKSNESAGQLKLLACRPNAMSS
mmetsp:Transcript_59610/g.134876  ORF Transcript_59610/g.134876 Transcript_59610/m.134876 type:complete len:276 (+) Transcript_59610:124-951(+)